MLKHLAVDPPSLQNGPLLGGLAHVAMLAEKKGLAHRLEYRRWHRDTLVKVGPSADAAPLLISSA